MGKSGKESDKDKYRDKPKYKKRINEAVNSRVYIDYSGTKPKIRFDVPGIKEQRKRYVSHGIFWCFAFAFLIAYISIGAIILTEDGLPNSSQINITNCYDIQINSSDNQIKFRCSDMENQNHSINITYSYSNVRLFGKDIKNKEVTSDSAYSVYIIDGKEYSHWSIMLYFGAIVFAIMFLILLPFRKYIGYKMMQNDGESAKAKYRWIFKPDHVFKRDKKWICEIPCFKNVCLEYDTTGDFQKYLLNINIIDLPVYILPKNKFRKGWKKPFHFLNKTKRFIKSVWHWKAEFIFSKRPKTGEMICNFD